MKMYTVLGLLFLLMLPIDCKLKTRKGQRKKQKSHELNSQKRNQHIVWGPFETECPKTVDRRLFDPSFKVCNHFYT